MRGWNHRGLKSQAADVVGAVIVKLATASLVPRVSFLSAVRVRFGSSTSLNCCLSCVDQHYEDPESEWKGTRLLTARALSAGRRAGEGAIWVRAAGLGLADRPA